MRIGIRAGLWRGVAVVLLLGAVYCAVQWGDSSSPDPADAATSSLTSTTSADAELDAELAAGKPAQLAAQEQQARPVAISIPAIGVTSRLIGLGLNRNGTVEVPADPGVAGWYRLGTRPGSLGSAVILGHVDSVGGPAVFYDLRTLGQGDVVDVRTAGGGSERFRVQSVRVYPNDEFPAQRVYAAQGRRVLNLVTCGGEYDAANGGYQANVVVQARWVHHTSS
jgi:sortase (surface protein transpeptidase)